MGMNSEKMQGGNSSEATKEAMDALELDSSDISKKTGSNEERDVDTSMNTGLGPGIDDNHNGGKVIWKRDSYFSILLGLRSKI